MKKNKWLLVVVITQLFVENVTIVLIIYFQKIKRAKYILKVFKLNLLFFDIKMPKEKKGPPKKRGRKPKNSTKSKNYIENSFKVAFTYIVKTT